MPMSKPEPDAPRRIEVFTGAGRRRTWTVEEKAAFVAESHVAGETVCGVARRHGLTPLHTIVLELARSAAEAELDLAQVRQVRAALIARVSSLGSFDAAGILSLVARDRRRRCQYARALLSPSLSVV